MPILGLQKLLLILGSKAAVEFRDRVLECFNRVPAGDRTLIREIAVNAAHTGRCSRSRGRRWRKRSRSDQDDRHYTRFVCLCVCSRRRARRTRKHKQR